MNSDFIPALLQLMNTYFNLHISQSYQLRRTLSKREVDPNAVTAPPYFVAVQQWLHREHGYQFNPGDATFIQFNPNKASVGESTQAIASALCQLSEKFWQRFQQQQGKESEPPDYFVTVLDYLETQYHVWFSYERGLFVEI
ncbi:hypothetical protein [Tunicatimonas pelagia]|uniref:hypothetical protein n=1 Tax=Tunicatimonas pelagia TaxID=931531 RepID=UPI002666AEA3|nr:hypothetical protein [Tunicatimonas pelagia]WKN44731.1 hypothetical protein P0M28_07105 [Tunicatimonas pelagia]